MDGFGDNFDQADVDPAAEFLAREKDQLGGLADDVIAPAVGESAPASGDSLILNCHNFNRVPNSIILDFKKNQMHVKNNIKFERKIK